MRFIRGKVPVALAHNTRRATTSAMSSSVSTTASAVASRVGRRAGSVGPSAGAAPAPRRVGPVLSRRPDSRRGGGSAPSHVARVVRKGPEPGEISEQEREYREMMRLSKEWMAYDPDELPESAPAPWETHLKNLMEEGPWPCWEPDRPESDFEQEPEFIPFKETPKAYSAFDDKAKIYHEQLKAERAEATAKRQTEIRSRRWMSMDDDVRLGEIPSCDESGWSHDKILDLIGYPEDVAKAMEEYSVLTYDPRFPIDNTWIPPPEPDTWSFLQNIGRAAAGEDDAAITEDLAAKNGIYQRLDSDVEGNEFLNQTSEAKLARAIDIGEDEEEEEEEDSAWESGSEEDGAK